MDEHAAFIITPEQNQVAQSVLEEVSRFALQDGRTMERLDSEQEREQEQEQEKEVRVKRDQEIEVEKFVDREYSRTEESPNAWHISLLKEDPREVGTGGKLGTDDHPFYPMSSFKLRYQEPLHYPSYLSVSRNYFNPGWMGLRRVKNVVMVVEYTPGHTSVRSPSSTRALSTIEQEASKKALESAFTLLSSVKEEDVEATPDNVLSMNQLRSAIRVATDTEVHEDTLKDVVARYGTNGYVDVVGLRDLLTSGELRVVEEGRHFVAVSLAEAETLRSILHMQDNKPLQGGVGLALRYTPMQTLGSSHHKKTPTGPGATGVVFDASVNWRMGTEAATLTPNYQLLSAHNCMRFLDCAQHYPAHALHSLIRSLQMDDVRARERFFTTTVGSRRRMERKWQDTPLAKVFTTKNEWVLLKTHAQAVFIREALKQKGLTLWEAFTSFDADDNGVLSPAEFYGAMKFLGLPDVSAEDVVDMIEAADTNGDGTVDYREYLEMLKSKEEREEEKEEEEDEEDQEERALPPKIEPFGADILREVMVARKKEGMLRQREDRKQQQAFQQALDIKVFEEELKASQKRERGANPHVSKVVEGEGTSSTHLTEFRFTGNTQPIRMVHSGKWKFVAIRDTDSTKAKIEMKCEQGHVLVHDSQYWEKCLMCGRQQCSLRCNECDNNDVCSLCHNRWVEEHKKKAQDLGDKLTFANCLSGCSFSLQVPAAGAGLAVDLDKPPPEITCKAFTLTFEMRVERLPPRGHLAALTRFFPSSYGRTRRRHEASVYINYQGMVLDAVEAQARVKVEKQQKKVVKEKKGKEDEAKPVNMVVNNKWQVVSVCADADAGSIATYVNGHLCWTSSTLGEDQLTLRHQMIVLGG